MTTIPHNLQGPWSNVGYLLLAHVMNRPPRNEVLDMDWVSRLLDITEYQLRTILHRDNKDADTWFPEMLLRLREQGYPELVIFEQNNHMHYTIAEPLDYEVEILIVDNGMQYVHRNGR